MMLRLTIGLGIVLGLGLGLAASEDGCRQPAPRADAARRAFQRKLTELHSNELFERTMAASTMVNACCRSRVVYRLHRPTPFDRARGCGEMERLLRTERDPRVINSLFGRWDPDCQLNFSGSALTATCLSGEGCPFDLHMSVVRALADAAPSSGLLPALLGHLEQMRDDEQATSPLRQSGFAYSFSSAMASLGDLELRSMIELTASPDQLTRGIAVQAFGIVLENAPLDLPEALTALERASEDAVPEISTNARRAAKAYRAHAGLPPEVTIVRHVATAPHPYLLEPVIRLLAVRRSLCRTPAAQAVLEVLASDARPDVAAAARRGLTLRPRCAEKATTAITHDHPAPASGARSR